MDILLHFCLVLIIASVEFIAVVTSGEVKLLRYKRDTRYCKDKFKVLHTHSACRPRSSQFKSGGVTSGDQLTILQEHNRYRGNVTPPATNMLKMSWDEEVAEIAQVWAETCSFGHDDNKDRNIPGCFSLGQNIGKGYTSWSDAIKDWWAEKKDFTYGGANDFHKVGHYTQLVWAVSTKIGCGMAVCGQYAFHVCNYGPAGNIGDINQPYKSGTACSECSNNCANKLCDCGQKVCENGGTLHLNNCSCTCKYQSFQVGDQCKLNCTDLKEPQKCGGKDWDLTGCKKYSNVVPYDCPETCGVCPYGAFNYKERNVTVSENNGSLKSSVPSMVLLCIVMLVIHIF